MQSMLIAPLQNLIHVSVSSVACAYLQKFPSAWKFFSKRLEIFGRAGVK